MIKQIHVFDKILCNNFLSGNPGNPPDLIAELVLEELCSINTEDLFCPICRSRDVDWNYCYSRSYRLIWDNPDIPIHIQTPTYQYCCHHCSSSGVELISTDLYIGKTDLSYHYVLGLLRNRLYPKNMNICDLNNMLYGKLSEESLKRWVKRFLADFSVLSHLCEVNEFDFLSEKVSYGDLFERFYISTGRLFMDYADVKMIISLDDEGNHCCVKKFC